MINENHFMRQWGIIHPDKLTMPILMVGAGNIGSWTALALMKLGCTNVTVIDFDSVEEHNVGSQLYTSLDVGETKVNAMNKRLGFLTENLPHTEVRKFDPTLPLDAFDIVISAVDSIAVRKDLFTALKGTTKLLVDGRMGGNSISIYTIPMGDAEKVALYEDTLFDSADALPIPCSERSVVYNCFIMAGYITDVVAHIANDYPVPAEMEMDLMNFTLFT